MSIDYRAVFEKLPGPLAVVLPDLSVAAVSQDYAHKVRLDPTDMIGRDLIDVLGVHTAGAVLQDSEELRTGMRDAMAEKRQVVLPVQRIVLPCTDGSSEQRYWNLLNKPLLDTRGRSWALLHSIHDVTEILRINGTLRARNESAGPAPPAAAKPAGPSAASNHAGAPDLWHMLDGLLEGVQILDHEFRYVYVNDTVVGQSRYGREELLGRSMPELYPGVQDTPMFQELRACMEDRAGRVIDNAFTYPDGSIGYFELNIQPVEAGILILSNDITQRVEAQEQVMRMREVLQETNQQLEERVAQRNTELLLVNEDLEVQMERNRKLGEHLKAQHGELLQSLQYARRIQDALFPHPDMLGLFNDVGFLSLPRDVVSGDLFWFADHGEHLLIAIADCTGHGVPGAMMSILAHGLLERRTATSITAPELVLEALDREMSAMLGQEQGPMQDGMDIALLRIGVHDLMLDHAGAYLDCLVLRNGELNVLKAGRTSIGGNRDAAPKYFDGSSMRLKPGDRLVLSTDGFASQFGGSKDRKIGTARFRELVTATAALPALEAIGSLERTFMEWKGDQEQVDDVMVLILDL